MKQYRVTVNGQSYDVAVEELGAGAAPARAAAPAPLAAPAPASAPVVAPAAAPAPVAASAGSLTVKSPMPGTVMSFKVAAGQSVNRGDVLLILEAMKMENEINAECDGTITSIVVNKGDSVMEGDVLLTIG